MMGGMTLGATHGTAGPAAPHRLVFANQLRGLAALSVAGSHLVGVFWVMRPFVALATASRAQDGTPPGLLAVFSYPWLNFGPLGVGIFFLISGLVIPISLAHHSRGSFLAARLLRIYPVYVAALAIELAVLHANAAFWGMPVPYGHWTVLSNALLIYNAVGQPSIDLVNWTLCIELKFYLLLALLAPGIRRGSLGTVLGAAAGLVAVNAALASGLLAPLQGALPDVAAMVGSEVPFLVFMLVGVLFQFHLSGRLGTPGLGAGVAALVGGTLLAWQWSPIAAQVPVVSVNYLYALGIFALAYALRRHARPVRLLDGMAAISFPFYLLHSAIGYAVLKYMMIMEGVAYYPALGMALGAAVGAATLLHVTLERWTIRAGKRLSRRPTGPDTIRRPQAGHASQHGAQVIP